MKVEATYKVTCVLYKNLDEFLRKRNEYSEWRVAKKEVNKDLTVRVFFVKCTSGKEIITLRNYLETEQTAKITVKVDGKVAYIGDAATLLNTSIISHKHLLAKTISSTTLLDDVLIIDI